jgi:hypothetical protein
MLSTVGYLRWDDEDPGSIADMIVAKLRNARRLTGVPTRSPEAGQDQSGKDTH